MPLEKDFSVVADSTISSSPRNDFDAPESAEGVKRPMRTYGRRQQETVVEDPETSSTLLAPPATRQTIHNTAPLHLSEEVPATSPHELETSTRDSDQDDADEPLSNLPKFEFGWKKMLRDQDSEEEEEDVVMPAAPELDNAQGPALSFGPPSLLLPDTGNLFPSQNRSGDRDFPLPLPSTEDDIFGGIASQRGPSPPATEVDESFNLSSPPRKLAHRHTFGRKGLVIHDSDSEGEGEALAKSSPATASSSSKPQLFTPKSGSSSTQPTSDDEMPSKHNKGKSKEKRRAGGSTIGPLEFEELPLSTTKTRRKTKALGRNEQAEMLKEMSHSRSERDVAIPRTEQPSRHTKDNLLRKFYTGEKANPTPSEDDPIGAFTSPARAKTPERNTRRSSMQPIIMIGRATAPNLQEQQSLSDDHRDDFRAPDPKKPIAEEEVDGKGHRSLMEIKRRAMAQKGSSSRHQSYSDDDLEVVPPNPKIAVKEEEEHRRSAGKRQSEGRKRQMAMGRISTTKASAHTRASLSPLKKAHGGISATLNQRGGKGNLSHKELNAILAANAQQQAQALTRKKEEEWQKHGGRLAVKPEAQAGGLNDVIRSIAEKGLKAAESSTGNDMGMDYEDQSDDEWTPPERASGSRAASDEDQAGSEDEEDDASLNENVNEPDVDDETAKIRASRRLVITSDSEDEENDENAKPKERFARATLSSGPGTEDDEDKENNTKLMYDQSEDKENTAVVRHTHLGLPSRALFVDESMSPPFSPVAGPSTWVPRVRDEGSQSPTQRRRPFKELVSEEPILPTQIGTTSLTQSFADKLIKASPSASMLAPAPSLKPLFPAASGSNGFSQFSDGERDQFTPAPLLQPGFSDLFEAETQDSLSNRDGSKLKRQESLNLTQDIAGLQPAFNVDDDLLRKADDIFEKEQALLVESAVKEAPKKKGKVYVNESGFLTQTVPPGGTQVGQLGPMASGSKNVGRTPLRTLSMSTGYPESPESGLRRLRRRDMTPPMNDQAMDGATQSLNAFDILRKGAHKVKQRETLKDRKDLAEFFEDEAAESDEEDTFGFRKVKTGEDEEDGEDLDQSLPELMDDKEIDEKVVAPELIHEKYMEQLEEQDKADEAFHQGLVQGQQRLKRRHGVGIDDSDDDSEDENNDRIRRAMKKSRKSDRGDIKALEANDATRAFAEAYNVALKDDEDEFAYLKRDLAPEDIVADRMRMDEDDEAESDDDQENIPETFTRDELIQKVREQKEQGLEDVEMDPTDVSWLDNDEEEEVPRVKTVNIRQRRAGRAQDTEQMEMEAMGPAFRKPVNPVGQSSKQWFAQETKSRNAGTSRSVGGSAITGHAKAKAKTNGGSLRKGSLPSSASSASTGGSKPVKAAASAISIISDKRRHFE
ncbi:hypothetical protein D9613_005412 [Agrocybe pediades]|uniref:DNA replication checkpoint mediator MRC1 domain-containing protein n=1 Tax=Agrocybe pediades TaxID=84607 RepID=A0A8H4QYB7_9AGAR|nr:hypothetical protein D9613_005412 [Agrocybe pediades]